MSMNIAHFLRDLFVIILKLRKYGKITIMKSKTYILIENNVVLPRKIEQECAEPVEFMLLL